MSGTNSVSKDIEGISICDGGTTIQLTKIASDHVEVAIHQDDSRVAPNTISWWHEVVWYSCCPPHSLLYKANNYINEETYGVRSEFRKKKEDELTEFAASER